VIRSLCHEVKHGLPGSDHAVALELGTRVNASHKRLISRLLLIAELDIEEAKFVPPGSGFAALEEMTSLGGSTRHECHASAIHSWETHK
jgi:hypothetical protein